MADITGKNLSEHMQDWKKSHRMGLTDEIATEGRKINSLEHLKKDKRDTRRQNALTE